MNRTVTITYDPATQQSTTEASWHIRPVTCPEPLGLEGVQSAVRVWGFAGVDATLVVVGEDQ